MNRILALVTAIVSALCPAARADWPMLHGSAAHDGFVDGALKPPFRLVWERHFTGERLGTAMDPIVADGKLFVATHSGNVYALDATTAQPIWRFAANGAFLQSPAFGDGRVFAACSDGRVYALDAQTGRMLWQSEPVPGGFSASPIIDQKTVFIGSRSGEFMALNAEDGKVRWRQSLGAPVRQTAAVADGRVFVTGEDLRVRCFVESDGKPIWASEQLTGQTARDYYPIIVKTAQGTRVIVRTNPILNMGQRIARDRNVLARNAGADDSDWRKLDAWLKSDAAHGTAHLWVKEQRAIIEYLGKSRDARTFFVLDAETGKESQTAPVLWVAGCQGVGAMPARARDGRLLVFGRSAYGNWNHGVAPMVALGLLDLTKNEIEPLFHKQGKQPPWNCFWGTADESQNFVVVGDTVIIIHQGTLSGFDLRTNNLFPICGERDSYGGFKNPAWARNEWHGPGRASVAILGDRMYWQTGSRILCIASGQSGQRAGEVAIDGTNVPTQRAPAPAPADFDQLRQQLIAAVRELLSRDWAPLFTDPGLSGRIFLFDDSRSVFEALSWAYPHLPRELQTQVKTYLAREFDAHPPFSAQSNYPLNVGAPREWFWVPAEFRSRLGTDPRPQAFGGVYAAYLYGRRCDEMDRVLAAWTAIEASHASFQKSGWKLDPDKGDLFANRYLASLRACEALADRVGDAGIGRNCRKQADHLTDALLAWWNRAAEKETLGSISGSSQLDAFIGSGDGISFRVAPHRHKLALFQDLTPEIATAIRSRAPEASAKVWQVFSALYRTWPLQGEERQVHFGENFVDAPDLALDGFEAQAWIEKSDTAALVRNVDEPFCRADLCYIIKLAITLETTKRHD